MRRVALVIFGLCLPFMLVPTAGANWSAGDSVTLEIEGRPLRVSPDGNWIAGLNPDREVCVWSVPDLDAICGEDIGEVSAEHVAWAPDSSAVAVSHNAFLTFRDSDIYVLSVDGSFSNLTDVEGELEPTDVVFGDSDVEGESVLDVAPLWSADGASIYFSRSIASDAGQSTSLSAVDVATGEIEELAAISDETIGVTTRSLLLDAEGGVIYSVDYPFIDADFNGIFRLNPETGESEQLVPDEREEFLFPVAISEDGNSLLYSAGASDPTQGYDVRMLDLESGGSTQLDQPVIDGDPARFTSLPVFVGLGYDIAYLAQTSSGPVLATGISVPQIALEDVEPGSRLQWLGDDTLVLIGPGEAVTFVEMVPPPPCSCTPPDDQQ